MGIDLEKVRLSQDFAALTRTEKLLVHVPVRKPAKHQFFRVHPGEDYRLECFIVEIDGDRWVVYPSGRVTVYNLDEFGLVFERGTGPDKVRRTSRYSPSGPRRQDAALAELSNEDLSQLFRASQAEQTSPEAGYGRAAGR